MHVRVRLPTFATLPHHLPRTHTHSRARTRRYNNYSTPPTQQRLKKCNSESDCQNASIALNVCVGSIICPTQATAFTKAVEGGKLEGDLEQAFTAMHNCMTTFETTSKREIAELLAKTK